MRVVLVSILFLCSASVGRIPAKEDKDKLKKVLDTNEQNFSKN